MSSRGAGLPTHPTPPGSIIVVSGLPRSGTSLLMQMLEAGGVEVVTDRLRTADDSNPLGYFEDERVKRLRDGDDEWVAAAAGKAIKVVSPLLQYLPARYSYKLIFLLRSVEEILASQRRMLSRLGQDAGSGNDTELASAYRAHLTSMEPWLAARPHLETMYLHYRDLVEDPDGNAIRISRFVGRRLDTAAMVKAVDPTLYRERHE